MLKLSKTTNSPNSVCFGMFIVVTRPLQQGTVVATHLTQDWPLHKLYGDSFLLHEGVQLLITLKNNNTLNKPIIMTFISWVVVRDTTDFDAIFIIR